MISNGIDASFVVEDDDLICIRHGREPVCDDDNCDIGFLTYSQHCLSKGLLGLGVEVAGRFIEHEYRCLSDQGPREIEALALAAGQPYRILS